MCSTGCDWHVNIGSGDGSALKKRQAITWTNDDPVHWCIYTSLAFKR